MAHYSNSNQCYRVIGHYHMSPSHAHSVKRNVFSGIPAHTREHSGSKILLFAATFADFLQVHVGTIEEEEKREMIANCKTNRKLAKTMTALTAALMTGTLNMETLLQLCFEMQWLYFGD